MAPHVRTFTIASTPDVAISKREAELLAFMHDATGPQGCFYNAEQVAANLALVANVACSRTTARRMLQRFTELGFLATFIDPEYDARRWYFVHDGPYCEMTEVIYNSYHGSDN